MEKLLQGKKKVYIGLITGITLAAGVFGFTADDNHLDYTSSGINFSGQTIFKAVFFGDRAVGSFIPQIADQAAPTVDKAGITKVMRKISLSHPKFFQSFKLAMESGDPIKISTALNGARSMLDAESHEVIQQNQSKVEGLDVYVTTAGTDITWVPGPLNNLAKSTQTDTNPNLALEREKAIAYLAVQLKK